MNAPPPILIAGPTAVGKSDVAMAVAEMIGGEIVVVDSMQVYRGLDIGTAKPSASDRARVPHHLLDVAAITQPFDAAKFVELAHPVMREISARGRVPTLCGGTGLYFKALLAGVGVAPPGDATLRAQLNRSPLSELLAELQRCDPALFERIDRQNRRRVIRAVEVCRLTGKPFSTQQAAWDHEPLALDHQEFVFVGLRRGKEDLRRRIDERVDRMFELGLVAETRVLLNQGLEKNPTAMQAIGYRQVVEHLRGMRSLAETIELIKIRTRQFAKRQITWFQRHASLQWITLDVDTSAATVADQIVKAHRTLPT